MYWVSHSDHIQSKTSCRLETIRYFCGRAGRHEIDLHERQIASTAINDTRVLDTGDKEELARVGLERLGKGPWSVEEGAGPAYNVPSTFDPENRLFSSPTRAGHVQTRDWLDYRWEAARNRNPGPGSFEHTTTDRTGKWDAPIERLTSGLPQSKACQGSFAYTMGLPRKMLPHMDPLSSARITPSVQTHESFTFDKTGKAITFLETCLSGVKASPTPRIAQKTPYTGGDLMFTRDPNNGVPGVGSYEAEVS